MTGPTDDRCSICMRPRTECAARRLEPLPPAGFSSPLPIHRTEANGGRVCGTCDGSGCPDCTDPA